MNKVILIGRLTKDPEIRYTTKNNPVASFSLAVNRDYINENGEREADFINIVVWNKQAENCSKYINKGSQISIEGRIQTRSYEDKNGEKRYTTEVIADQVHFLDNKKDKKEPDYRDMNIKTEKKESNTLDLSIDDDELPF